MFIFFYFNSVFPTPTLGPLKHPEDLEAVVACEISSGRAGM